MADESSGTATEPQQITVEQLAAQLSKKAPPGKAGKPAGGAGPESRPAEEAPAGGGTGTESDLFQSASLTGEEAERAAGSGEAAPGDDGAPGGEGGEGGEGEPPKPGTPEWWQKRVTKFTARQKELEERLATVEQRAEEAEAKLDKARREGGGKTKAWNFQEQELQAQLTHKREVLRWAEENPEGATLRDDKGNEVVYSAEQVRAIKLSALEDIGDLRGQVREHQASLTRAREYWDAEAVKAYPALKDPNSEEAKNVELILEKLPWLREVPDARMSLADMFAGRAARLKKPVAGNGAHAANGDKPPLKPARIPGAAGAAPARTAEGEPSQEVKQAREAFFQSGRTEDLARCFAAERKAKKA